MLVPTASKLAVDKDPYVSKGFEIPLSVIDEAAKAERALRSKPATADEVFRYLQRNLQIATYEDLSLYLGTKLSDGKDIQVYEEKKNGPLKLKLT